MHDGRTTLQIDLSVIGRDKYAPSQSFRVGLKSYYLVGQTFESKGSGYNFQGKTASTMKSVARYHLFKISRALSIVNFLIPCYSNLGNTLDATKITSR